MKNRRNIVVAFLLCACLIVGVGFAALTDELTITGSASVGYDEAEKAYDADIYFLSGDIVSSSNQATDDYKDTYTVVEKEDEASFTVGTLKAKGDSVTFKFTIKNDSEDVITNLTVRVTNTNETYFLVTPSFTTETIEANGEKDILVTVELIKTPILSEGQDPITGSFTITIEAIDAASANANN